MKRLLTGLVCAAITFSSPLSASDTGIKIDSMILGEGLQSGSANGFYADAAREVLKVWGGEFSFTIAPFKRVVRNFRAGASDCIWALDKALLKDIGLDVSSFIESAPLLNSSQRIFTRRDEPVISSLEALKGKRIAVLIGTNLQTELKPIGAEIVELNSQEAKLKLLRVHRVDAVLGWMPDIAIAAKRNGLPMPDYDARLAVRKSGVGFVCQDDPVGRTFIGEINDAIKSVQASAAFETIKVRYLGMSHAAYGI